MQELMHQKEACLEDNRNRLKQVQNLEDLIHFDIKTPPQKKAYFPHARQQVADRLMKQLSHEFKEQTKQARTQRASSQPPETTLAQIEKDPIPVLKSLFTEERKTFKAKHPIMKKYQTAVSTDRQARSTTSMQLAARVPLQSVGGSSLAQLEQYKQRLLQIQQQQDDYKAPTYDMDLKSVVLNPNQRKVQTQSGIPKKDRRTENHQLKHPKTLYSAFDQQIDPQKSELLRRKMKQEAKKDHELQEEQKKKFKTSQMQNIVHGDVTEHFQFPEQHQRLVEQVHKFQQAQTHSQRRFTSQSSLQPVKQQSSARRAVVCTPNLQEESNDFFQGPVYLPPVVDDKLRFDLNVQEFADDSEEVRNLESRFGTKQQPNRQQSQSFRSQTSFGQHVQDKYLKFTRQQSYHAAASESQMQPLVQVNRILVKPFEKSPKKKVFNLTESLAKAKQQSRVNLTQEETNELTQEIINTDSSAQNINGISAGAALASNNQINAQSNENIKISRETTEEMVHPLGEEKLLGKTFESDDSIDKEPSSQYEHAQDGAQNEAFALPYSNNATASGHVNSGKVKNTTRYQHKNAKEFRKRKTYVSSGNNPMGDNSVSTLNELDGQIRAQKSKQEEENGSPNQVYTNESLEAQPQIDTQLRVQRHAVGRKHLQIVENGSSSSPSPTFAKQILQTINDTQNYTTTSFKEPMPACDFTETQQVAALDQYQVHYQALNEDRHQYFNMIRSNGFQPRRFKKNPRFSLHTHNPAQPQQATQQTISLNEGFLSLLTSATQPQNQNVSNSVVQQIMSQTNASQPGVVHENLAEDLQQISSMSAGRDEAILNTTGTGVDISLDDCTSSTVHAVLEPAKTGPIQVIRTNPTAAILGRKLDVSNDYGENKNTKQSRSPVQNKGGQTEILEQSPNQLQVKFKDPFDQVLLERYIDNALLTSFRTMSGQNNTISYSMKIVHDKFSPIPATAGLQANQLYPLQNQQPNGLQTVEESTQPYQYPTLNQLNQTIDEQKCSDPQSTDYPTQSGSFNVVAQRKLNSRGHSSQDRYYKKPTLQQQKLATISDGTQNDEKSVEAIRTKNLRETVKITGAKHFQRQATFDSEGGQSPDAYPRFASRLGGPEKRLNLNIDIAKVVPEDQPASAANVMQSLRRSDPKAFTNEHHSTKFQQVTLNQQSNEELITKGDAQIAIKMSPSPMHSNEFLPQGQTALTLVATDQQKETNTDFQQLESEVTSQVNATGTQQNDCLPEDDLYSSRIQDLLARMKSLIQVQPVPSEVKQPPPTTESSIERYIQRHKHSSPPPYSQDLLQNHNLKKQISKQQSASLQVSLPQVQNQGTAQPVQVIDLSRIKSDNQQTNSSGELNINAPPSQPKSSSMIGAYKKGKNKSPSLIQTNKLQDSQKTALLKSSVETVNNHHEEISALKLNQQLQSTAEQLDCKTIQEFQMKPLLTVEKIQIQTYQQQAHDNANHTVQQESESVTPEQIQLNTQSDMPQPLFTMQQHDLDTMIHAYLSETNPPNSAQAGGRPTAATNVINSPPRTAPGPQDGEPSMQLTVKLLQKDEQSRSLGRHLKLMIDKLYSKEKQFVYAKQNQREDCLGATSVVFNLNKAHHIDNIPKDFQEMRQKGAATGRSDQQTNIEQFGIGLLGQKIAIPKHPSKK